MLERVCHSCGDRKLVQNRYDAGSKLCLACRRNPKVKPADPRVDWVFTYFRWEPGALAAVKAAEDRLWSHVQRGDPDECWNWRHLLKGHSRPALFVPGIRRGMPAAWVSWMIANDQLVPDYMMVRHSCDNRLCENNRHLLIGTNRDNMIDMISRGRAPLRRPAIPKVVREEIREKWLAGVSYKELADEYCSRYELSRGVIGKSITRRYAEDRYPALWDIPNAMSESAHTQEKTFFSCVGDY